MANRKLNRKRISLSSSDAAHLYELALESFQVDQKGGVCSLCLELKKRLEKYLGKSEVRAIKHYIKKHPYHSVDWTPLSKIRKKH